MRGGGSRDTPTPVSSVVAPSSPVREKGGQSYSHSSPLSQFHTIMHIPFHSPLSQCVSHYWLVGCKIKTSCHEHAFFGVCCDYKGTIQTREHLEFASQTLYFVKL